MERDDEKVTLDKLETLNPAIYSDRPLLDLQIMHNESLDLGQGQTSLNAEENENGSLAHEIIIN